MRSFKIHFTVMAVGFVAVIGGLFALAAYEHKKWEEFAATHDCKVIGKIAGYHTYGYYNGKYQTYYVPGKTTYRCNDGVDYTR